MEDDHAGGARLHWRLSADATVVRVDYVRRSARLPLASSLCAVSASFARISPLYVSCTGVNYFDLVHGPYANMSFTPEIIAGMGYAALQSAALPKLLAALDAIGCAAAADREKLEVKRFLNRLLGLPLAEQTLLFDAFSATLDAVVG